MPRAKVTEAAAAAGAQAAEVAQVAANLAAATAAAEAAAERAGADDATGADDGRDADVDENRPSSADGDGRASGGEESEAETVEGQPDSTRALAACKTLGIPRHP